MPPPRFALGRAGPFILIGAVSLFLTIPVTTQAQTIRGVVLDAENDAPIAVAQVVLLNRAENRLQTVVTDGDGRFSFELRAPGRYYLRASRIGYAEVTTAAFDVLDGEVMQVEVRISTRPIELPPLTIIGERAPRVLDPWLERGGYYEREARYRNVGRFLNVEDLERLPSVHLHQLVANMPNVRIRYGPGRDLRVTDRRGRGVCWQLNGRPIPRGVDPSELIIPSMLVAVEVYPFGVGPAELGGGGCVIIGFWTGFRDP